MSIKVHFKPKKPRRSPWRKGECPIPPEKRFQKTKNGIKDPKICTEHKTNMQKAEAILNELEREEPPVELFDDVRLFFPHVKDWDNKKVMFARAVMNGVAGDLDFLTFCTEHTDGRVAQVIKLGGVEKERTPLTDAECAAAAKALKISPSDSKPS